MDRGRSLNQLKPYTVPLPPASLNGLSPPLDLALASASIGAVLVCKSCNTAKTLLLIDECRYGGFRVVATLFYVEYLHSIVLLV